MSRFVMDERKYIISVIFGIMMAAGSVAGSVYLMHSGSGEATEYLKEFFSQKINNINKYSVFINSLKSNLIMLGVVFFAGFFKLGSMIAGACILRKGFITGFTAAAFIKCFGFKGVLISMAYFPCLLLIIPAFCLFCSISSCFSIKNNHFQKNFIIPYIFFALLIVTIFCAASFLEGYLTTTFMSELSEIL